MNILKPKANCTLQQNSHKNDKESSLSRDVTEYLASERQAARCIDQKTPHQ
jgi:hypothetical protein